MKIVVLCEGATEEALKQGLREFVQSRAEGVGRVGIETRSLDGPVLRKKLARLVELNLAKSDVLGVVALTDVYPDFDNAKEAKDALRRFAGSGQADAKFRPHAAQFDVEAWIMPFWPQIGMHLGVKAASPGARPEEINTQRPPSHHLRELYAKAKQRYEKVIDGAKWLTAEKLGTAAGHCPELKSFLNSLLELAGADKLP